MTEETKSQKWQRLANERYVKAVHRIRMLEGLANTQNYEYTEEQVNMLADNLHIEVDAIAGMMKAKLNPVKEEAPGIQPLFGQQEMEV